MSLAPIILFVYNRPEHTKRTVEALANNLLAEESELFIFSDAPANNENKGKVDEVRAYIKTIDNFRKIYIINREKNFGLAQTIISGITEVINSYGKAIVLEDDILTSRYFLKYMNEALRLYEDDERVMHISGYMFPIHTLDFPETFFYNQTSCWGWATWLRAWKRFNHDPEFLLQTIKKQKRLKEFNLDGSHDFTDQLKKNIDGRLNTWAIKWQASVFIAEGLCLHPKKSLVNNIGHDGTGVHCGKSNEFQVSLFEKSLRIERINLIESSEARKRMSIFFKSKRENIIKKAIKKAKKFYNYEK